MPTKTALITGASAGIGASLARVFAANGFDLVLTARRVDRLEALAQEIGKAHGRTVRVIAADLADPAAPSRLFDELTRAGVTIDALVNNAGYGLPGGLLHSSWDQHRDFIQVMVTRSPSSATGSRRAWWSGSAAGSSTSARWRGWSPARPATRSTVR